MFGRDTLPTERLGSLLIAPKTRGFTLIELMIVVAIAGVLDVCRARLPRLFASSQQQQSRYSLSARYRLGSV